MDATKVTKLLKELMKLLQDVPEEDYEKFKYELEEIKDVLGPWYMADYLLYQGS